MSADPDRIRILRAGRGSARGVQPTVRRDRALAARPSSPGGEQLAGRPRDRQHARPPPARTSLPTTVSGRCRMRAHGGTSRTECRGGTHEFGLPTFPSPLVDAPTGTSGRADARRCSSMKSSTMAQLALTLLRDRLPLTLGTITAEPGGPTTWEGRYKAASAPTTRCCCIEATGAVDCYGAADGARPGERTRVSVDATAPPRVPPCADGAEVSAVLRTASGIAVRMLRSAHRGMVTTEHEGVPARDRRLRGRPVDARRRGHPHPWQLSTWHQARVSWNAGTGAGSCEVEATSRTNAQPIRPLDSRA